VHREISKNANLEELPEGLIGGLRNVERVQIYDNPKLRSIPAGLLMGTASLLTMYAHASR
jgi:hypothetical protein